MSGLPPEVARSLHGPVVALQRATEALACRLDRLADPGLSEAAREEDTERLNAEIRDAGVALDTFGEAVFGEERDRVVVHIGCVVKVAPTRWRRHRWGREEPAGG